MTLSFTDVRVPLAEFELAVDLTLEGSFVSIGGPSGAGKTSLLEVIAGLRTPSRGRIAHGETTLVDVGAGVSLSPRDRGVGYLTQDDTLFPHLSVEKNLRYGARPHDGHEAQVVEALGLAPLLHRSPRELSGGERRRVALGRALLRPSRLLLLDEPLTGLNAELRERVLALLLRVKAAWGRDILYVTHTADEVRNLADETLVVLAGRVALSSARPG